MTSTLPNVTHEHHARLMGHVDQLPTLGDMLLVAPLEELRPRLDEADELLNGLLIPHLEAAEANLYPELERMLQNRHSMTPMRREHGQIRTAIDQLLTLKRAVDAGRFGTREQIALRRAVFQLYALLKVHLAEELLYAGIVEHGASAEDEQTLATAMEHPGISAF